MNSVSWFFYFVGFSEKFFYAMLLLAIFSMVTAIASAIMAGDCYGSDATNRKATHMKRVKRSVQIGAACLMAAVFVPGKMTLYAIAASEVGQRIAQTPVANELASDANEILRGYLKKLKDGLKEDK